jgi:hypothetical protein
MIHLFEARSSFACDDVSFSCFGLEGYCAAKCYGGNESPSLILTVSDVGCAPIPTLLVLILMGIALMGSVSMAVADVATG